MSLGAGRPGRWITTASADLTQTGHAGVELELKDKRRCRYRQSDVLDPAHLRLQATPASQEGRARALQGVQQHPCPTFLDARNSPPSNCRNGKRLQILPNVPCRTKPPSENQWKPRKEYTGDPQ